MIFDNEEQKQIILELLGAVTIPGKALDKLYQFKQEVIAGEIKNHSEKKSEEND